MKNNFFISSHMESVLKDFWILTTTCHGTARHGNTWSWSAPLPGDEIPREDLPSLRQPRPKRSIWSFNFFFTFVLCVSFFFFNSPHNFCILLGFRGSGRIWRVLGPFWMILDQIGSYGITFDNCWPFRTILDPFGTFWTILDHAMPFLTILE